MIFLLQSILIYCQHITLLLEDAVKFIDTIVANLLSMSESLDAAQKKWDAIKEFFYL